MSTYPLFQGNRPSNVNKDAKYHVKHGKNGPVVGIVYETTDDERWYATTDEHPVLVQMVNDVKTSHGDQPNGGFYINEYQQVIVPVMSDDEYYLAGRYELPLRFQFEGHTLSGEPFDMSGNPLTPGDEWSGPHPGIPYVLGIRKGMDIRYTITPRPNVEKDVRLSKAIGADAARKTIEQVRSVRGFAGGRFYVNEHRAMFTPVQEGYDLRYVYLGQLALDAWFSQPHSEPELTPSASDEDGDETHSIR